MKFQNLQRRKFLQALAEKPSIESPDDTLTLRCKFNFSYFDVQVASQSFEDWDHGELVSLLDKLKEYSKDSLKYWQHQGRLNIYKSIPHHSKMTLPKYVPHQAVWAAFRLEKDRRLIGFLIPDEFDNKAHCKTGRLFDGNVFHVVFLDREHQFYPMDIKENKN